MRRAARAAAVAVVAIVFPMAATAGALFDVPTAESLTSSTSTSTSTTSTTAPAGTDVPVIAPELLEDPLATVDGLLAPLTDVPLPGSPSPESAPSPDGGPNTTDPAPSSPPPSEDTSTSGADSTTAGDPSSNDRSSSEPTTTSPSSSGAASTPAPSGAAPLALSTSSPAAAERRAIQRGGPAPDGGPNRSTNAARPLRVRSTADLIAALRAAGAGPAAVARAMAPFPIAGVATYDGRLGPGQMALVTTPDGAPVISPEDGSVLASGTDWITIGTSRGARFQLAGLARVQPLAVGDRVRRAEVLGFLAGGATLRFGLSTDQATFDPVPVLDGWLARATEAVHAFRSAPPRSEIAVRHSPRSVVPRPELGFVTAAARSAVAASTENAAAWTPVLMAGLVGAWVLFQISRTRTRRDH